MAMVVRVEPAYNGKIAVQSNNSLNGTVLSNSLTQEVLLAIYQNQPELRGFLFTEYTTVGGSYAPADIDPSLIHAYDSGELTHNPAAVYPANTLGKALVETRAKIDGFDSAFVRPSTRMAVGFDFANSRFLDPKIPFSRNSIGTYFDRNGVMKTAAANKPRFTHDPITKESLGLLFEESRTNLNSYSSDIQNALYGKLGATVNNATSNFLDGVVSQQLVEDTTNGQHQITKNVAGITAGANIAYSCYVKQNVGSRIVRLRFVNGANSFLADFNLELLQVVNTAVAGTATIETSSIETVGQWFRIGIIGRLDGTSTTASLNVAMLNLTNTIYTGDGTTAIAIAGIQIEEGLSFTSLIPTTTTTVLRDNDLISIAGALFMELFSGFEEGTMFLSARKAKKRVGGSYKFYARFFSANGNAINITDSALSIYNELTINSINQFNINAINIGEDGYFLNAFGFKKNNARAYINGNASTLDTNISTPDNITQLTIGGGMNTIIKQFAYYPRRLDDAELQSLTNSILVGKNPSKLPSIGDLGSGAFMSPYGILRTTGRQEFSVDGTGASITRNIRRPYDFSFEVVDNAGVTTMTATPATNCVANTDNSLTFTAPVGKTLTYAITPVYEY